MLLFESVSMPAKSLAFIIWILGTISSIALGFYTYTGSVKLGNSDRNKGKFEIFLAFTGCVYSMGAGLLGLGFVTLGNVIGPPWGTYYVKDVLGQATGVMTRLVAVFEIVMLVVMMYGS